MKPKKNLVRDAKTLHHKSISSLKFSMSAFNSYEEEGRLTRVLLHAQHSTEMLLKCVLAQNKEKVFDDKSGLSLSFEKCLNLCTSKYSLTSGEAGSFRAIDALRDEEQHWFIVIDEALLFLQMRALVTAYDEFQKRSLCLSLSDLIPDRVLPVSTKLPGDFDLLVDKEYEKVSKLLRPGKRRRDEARARIRSMLAMEALVTDEVSTSKKDVDRIEKAIKGGDEFSAVFPRLSTINTSQAGEGPTLKVHFTKREGAAVHFVAGDEPGGAAAVREIDLQKKYWIGAKKLAETVGLTPPRALALRRELNIDKDESCSHTFSFGKSKHVQFSDNASRKMKEALAQGIDMEDVWARNRP
ncbi:MULTISPECIES: hypothetical protein [unclassified Sulfitobacter]|uniref:hypothetical protein n=1 Tax=unclassified Sulfitobacter TaxID=196795 RepID=UPI0007C4013C|nr:MULTISPECIES: hypothetical protein [unclassified Sulfitobacter]KZY06419.1 hypothetical protein A3721_11825 [Sulfitobacter sp. HI0023]